MEQDRISLLNSARCLIEDRPFESDVALPLPSSEFIETTDALKPLLLALGRGELEAKGVFSRIRLDYPEFSRCSNDAQITQLSTEFRHNEQIILGIGEESHPTDIPPSMWWFEGAIWEKSTLWVANRKHFDEQRWRRLKIQPTVAFALERPYEFEELICFHEVTLSVDEIVRWADADTSTRSKEEKSTRSRVGRPSNANWPAIEAFLQDKIDAGATWHSWHTVWGDVLPMVKKVNPDVTNSQPYKSFANHLSRNNPKLLERLLPRIRTSRS